MMVLILFALLLGAGCSQQEVGVTIHPEWNGPPVRVPMPAQERHPYYRPGDCDNPVMVQCFIYNDPVLGVMVERKEYI